MLLGSALSRLAGFQNVVMLKARVNCYSSAMLKDLAAKARDDYGDYLAAEPVPLAAGVK